MRDIAKPGATKDRILIRLNYANVKIVGLVVAAILNFQITRKLYKMLETTQVIFLSSLVPVRGVRRKC
jgi:hypothetical protein